MQNSSTVRFKFRFVVWLGKLGQIMKGSLGYLSSMYFSTSLGLGEVVGPFPEIESWK